MHFSALFIVAQGSEYGPLFFWLMLVLVVVAATFWVVSWIRKRWLADDDSAGPIGFTLSDLRQMHKAGQLSTEEYEKARANMLEVDKGALTGRMVDRPWGDICDGNEKRRVLLEVCELMGIGTERSIAVGDGANDLPMMSVAGLSICYHGKPAVREQAMISIEDGGMDRALALFG